MRSERIRENLDIFDFALSAQLIAYIDALNSGCRVVPDPKWPSTKTVNFSMPD